MELALHGDGSSSFLDNLFSNGKDSSLGRSYRLLRSTDDNVGRIPAILRTFVDINLGICFIFDFVYRRSPSPEDASNRTCWNGKLENVIGLFLKFSCLWAGRLDSARKLQAYYLHREAQTLHQRRPSCHP